MELRLGALLAGLVSAAVLATACSQRPVAEEGAEDSPRHGGTLIVAVRQDVDSWNPYTASGSTALNVLELLYPRLVHEHWVAGREPEFVPWAAESWALSDDGRSLRVRLREAVHWSNGDPLTCEDLRFTFLAQRSDEIGWPGVYLKQHLLRVDCESEREAVFVFDRATSHQLLDANDDAVVPSAYGSVPFSEWMTRRWSDGLISVGPFRLARRVAGQEFVLERDDGFWQADRPLLDRVVFRVFADPEGTLRALLGGEIDLMEKVPPARAEVVERGPETRLIDLPSYSYAFLAWNTLDPQAYLEDRRRRGCETGECSESIDDLRRLGTDRPHPILADPRVRRALTLAIDRQDLVDGLWLGRARVATTPIVSALWAHDPAAALPYDLDQARALLDDAGWRRDPAGGIRRREGRELTLEVIVNADNVVRRNALQRIARQLAEIGVELRLSPLPRREYVSRARSKRFDGLLGGWRAGTRVEPQAILHCGAAVERGNNLGSWCDPRSDALLDEAASAPSREEAAPIWRRWQRLFAEEQPYTMLYEERVLIGISSRVRDARPTPLNPYAGIESWWVDGPDGADD